MTKRREFVKVGAATIFAVSVSPVLFQACKNAQKNESPEVPETTDLFFKLSLAQWSFHKALFAGEMDNLDFAAKAKELEFEGIEYVNIFFKDKAEDKAYLDQMNQKAADSEVVQILIMIDGEGNLGAMDLAERTKAVENHYKWVEAAKYLGCETIRVNARGEGSAEEVSTAAIDGLSRLSEFAAAENINVIVENHGGYSSDGKWMSNVLKQVGMDNCGSLPDFGNFCIKRDEENKCIEEYDRYQGMEDLMPFAKAVSAKSNEFDEDGNEIHTDFLKIMKIVKDHGYRGFVGVEYEGKDLSEEEGIIKTRELLLKVGRELS